MMTNNSAGQVKKCKDLRLAFMHAVVLTVITTGCVMNSGYLDVVPRERSEILVLSSDLGDLVDSTENVKYALFENIKGFQSASFFATTDGGYEVEVNADSGRYLVVNRDPVGQKVVRDYLDAYKKGDAAMRGFEHARQVVGYDTCGLPITRYEAKIPNKPLLMNRGVLLGAIIAAAPFAIIEALLAADPPDDYNSDIGVGYAMGVMYVMACGCFATPVGAFIGYRINRVVEAKQKYKVIYEARRPIKVD